MAEHQFVALFPGQGAQEAGMSRLLLEQFPFTKAFFEEASDATSLNLTKLTLEGPEDQLRLTAIGQPAILVTSYAWFEVLRRELDFRPWAGAGHSLGEYSAMLAAGTVDLTTAARLVNRRGTLMQEAVPVGKGAMAAIIGLEDAKVRELCEKATKGDNLVVPANFNSPGQVVIAGHREAVDRAQALCGDSESGFKARKFMPLKVSAPFHSPLMSPVAQKFYEDLQGAGWQDPAFPIVSNVDTTMRQTGDWAALLRDQIDHPVNWTETAELLLKEGASAFVEMGPGKVLTGLVKRVDRSANLFNCESMEGFKKFETAYREGLK